ARGSRRSAALGLALVAGAISFMVVRQWRLDHAASEPVAQVGCLAEPAEASRAPLAGPLPLVTDGWAGRVGNQVRPLQPIHGAVVLEPAKGTDAGVGAVLADSEGSVSTEWLASLLRPDHTRHFADRETAAIAPPIGDDAAALPPALPPCQRDHYER